MSWKSLWVMLDRLAIVAMIAASGTVLWAVTTAKASRANQESDSRIASVTGALPASVSARPSARGQLAARWAIAEFSDYQCPFCARHASEVFPSIDKDFVTTGKVKYLFMNLPIARIHPHAAAAAHAAECAGAQAQYWPMHDQLFRNQKELSRRRFVDYGKSVGLDTEAFTRCVSSPTDGLIASDQTLGQQLGIRSTPSFLIGEIRSDGSIDLRRRITGLLSYDEFKAVLVELIDGE
jgi:protein-disulfide isomerase